MYALQPEPESGKRWKVLGGGGLLAALAYTATLAWLSQLDRPHPKPTRRSVEMLMIKLPPQLPKPKDAPPAPRPEPKPEPVARATTPAPKEPHPMPMEPQRSEASQPAEPLVLGITLSSTVHGGRGPKVGVGNTLMGEPDRIAKTPRASRMVKQLPTQPTRRAPSGPSTSQVKTTKAKLKRSVTPAYPAQAKSKGIEGVVVLAITIGPDGRVETAQVLSGLGHGLDRSALTAAYRTLWSPATVNGQPVRSTRRFNVRFTLQS